MWTSSPKISFNTSPDIERERVLYATATAASGFYSQEGFIFTPMSISKIKSACIILPEHLSQLSPKYWHDAASISVTQPLLPTDYMRQALSKTKFPQVNAQKLIRLKKSWATINEDYWSAVHHYLPREIRWLGNIETRVTKFGPPSSFHLLTKKLHQPHVVYLREDMDIPMLGQIIVSSLFWPYQVDGTYSFSQRMAIVDFIMSRPEFSKLFNTTVCFSKNISRIQSNFHQSSLDYCRHLGIPLPQNDFDVVQKNQNLFGPKEYKVIKKLSEQRGEMLTFDEVADILWGQDEFTSYWAINKMIQRLRHKLTKIGLNGASLVAVRGRGFIWR